MRVYLDVSCLNRPFDDQSDVRIHLEAEAVLAVLHQFDRGQWAEVSSQISEIEIDSTPDPERRARVRLLLTADRTTVMLNESIFRRAERLSELGFKAADALHVASAENGGSDVLLSCDDRLCRTARRHRKILKVLVSNPLEWLKELSDADDIG